MDVCPFKAMFDDLYCLFLSRLAPLALLSLWSTWDYLRHVSPTIFWPAGATGHPSPQSTDGTRASDGWVMSWRASSTSNSIVRILLAHPQDLALHQEFSGGDCKQELQQSFGSGLQSTSKYYEILEKLWLLWNPMQLDFLSRFDVDSQKLATFCIQIAHSCPLLPHINSTLVHEILSSHADTLPSHEPRPYMNSRWDDEMSISISEYQVALPLEALNHAESLCW